MEDLEEKVFKFFTIRVSAYFRYVDDVFMITSKDKVTQILNSFNEQHDRLKFIIEYEENHCLNFLDLSVINKDNTIILDWYHKTFSGRYYRSIRIIPHVIR